MPGVESERALIIQRRSCRGSGVEGEAYSGWVLWSWKPGLGEWDSSVLREHPVMLFLFLFLAECKIPLWELPVLYSKRAKHRMLKANTGVLCLQN